MCCAARRAGLFGIDGYHSTISQSGTIARATANAASQVVLGGVSGVIDVQITGLTSGSASFVFEMWNGARWQAYPLVPVTTTGGLATASGAAVATVTADGDWTSGPNALPFQAGAKFRVRNNVAGTAASVTVVISAPIMLFLQLFDLTAVPADGVSTMKHVIPIAPYQWLPPISALVDYGRSCTNGAVWCLSTTEATKTIATGTGAWISGGSR
jgi:hypothetical protein